jgi:hypothetical protein
MPDPMVGEVGLGPPLWPVDESGGNDLHFDRPIVPNHPAFSGLLEESCLVPFRPSFHRADAFLFEDHRPRTLTLTATVPRTGKPAAQVPVWKVVATYSSARLDASS